MTAPTCVTCGGTGVLVICAGPNCNHTNDREYQCPSCATERELGPEPAADVAS